jgi:hypothetical protein
MPGMDGFINFNGTLEGSIAGGGGGDVTDVKVRDSQETTFESVVNEEGVAEIDLISYVRRNELTQAIENVENSIDNVEELVDIKQNVVNYSTEEQNTGRKWIDGKPLYAKTIIHDTPLSNRVWTDIINELNINIKMFDGYIYLDGYPYTQINYYRSTSEYSCGAIVNNEHTFRVYPSIDGATITCIVTLYYTK